ncbi:MAG: hypothetical protein IPJ41_08590 [Phycisphaerales bacterium]|nr:hypothetical protein [Phycisphaerales bacterium]
MAAGPVFASFAGVPGAAQAAAVGVGRDRPKLRVANWWSGRYELAEALPASAAALVSPLKARPPLAGGARRPASEQLRSARARAEARRARAQARLAGHRHGLREGRRHASGVNAGVAASVFVFLVFCLAIGGLALSLTARRGAQVGATLVDGGDDRALPVGAIPTNVAGGISVANDSRQVADPPTPVLPALSGRVLVVSDLLPPYDNQTGSMLKTWLSVMQSSGMHVVGTLEGLNLDDAELDRASDLSARARAVVGQIPLDSEDARTKLTAWLGESDAADLLIWIQASKTSGAGPEPHVFGSPSLVSDSPADSIASIQRMLLSPG